MNAHARRHARGSLIVALVMMLSLTVLGTGGAHAGDDPSVSPSSAPAGSIAVAHILVAPLDDAIAAVAITDEGAWAAAGAEANELAAFVASQPADVFALVASQSSDDLASAFDGGHLGRVTTKGATSSIPAPVVDAVRALDDPAPGTLLGPVRSEHGWHIVRIEDPASLPAAWSDNRSIEPAVVVVDLGAEPRQVLRFAPPDGATTTVMISATIGTTRSPGTGAALDLGNASLVASWTVTAVPDRAGIRLDLVLDGVDGLSFEGADETATMAATDLLAGVQASVVVAPNGLPVSSSVELPDGLDPVLAGAVWRSVEGVADAVGTYPDEPVGSGARWSTVREIPGQDGELGTLISTRTMLSPVDGQRLQLSTSTSRFATAGMAQEPGAGASLKLGESELSVATRIVEPGTLSLTTIERANGIAWYTPLGSGDIVTRTIVANLDLATATAE